MGPKMQDVENLCIQRATLSPHWLPGGNAFWYIQKAQPEETKFILVDCIKGLRQLAFDHGGLAAELSKQTGRETKPDNLPFWWINVAQDGAWTRFQLDGQTWQFGKSGILEPWNGEFDAGEFDKGCKDAPSPASTQNSSITFVNQTTSPLTYSWINEKGETVQHGTVQVSQTVVQQTYVGHIWRLAVHGTEKKIACAVKNEPSIATIEELRGDLIIKWATKEATEPSDPAKDAAGSEKGLTPFVRDFNIWTRKSDGTETLVSYDGFVDNAFKTDHLYQTSDERYLVAWQCKPESNHLVHMVEPSPEGQLQPKLHSIPYIKPGDNVEVKRPRLFDLVAGEEIRVDDSLFRNPYSLTNIGWSKDDQNYRFIFNERGHQNLRVLDIDLKGNVKALVEEKSRTFVDYEHKTYYKMIESQNGLLWASERDMWNHLYLFDLKDGKLKNQVTKGEWVVHSVESVDEEKQHVYFRGLGMVPGQDPYYAHLARINLDGSDLRILTEGDGTHTWEWGPEKRYLLDSWSRVDYPPQIVVRDGQTGKLITELEKTPLQMLIDAGWKAPVIFTAPGRDKTTLIYGVLILPIDFDPSKKFPILEQIYAGPHDQYAPKAFQRFAPARERMKGYILVMVDGMGTNWRSKVFHDVCYKNLKDAGFADRIAWIRAAAETRPWMDISRVGCYGFSAGGQNAVAAVLHHSDFYKAAFALAGCHDNRMNKLPWNEMWMGYPLDKSYVESSNVVHAEKLGGALMLAVGGLDRNVDPASTMQLVDALIKADKDFELAFVPSGGHYLSKMPWLKRQQDNFFKKHLLEC